jgi:hypothetical protein
MQSVPNRPRQGAVRREWHALYKDCNAALAHLGRSLRASQEAVIPKAFAAAKALASLMGWAPLMGQALCVVVLP